MPPNPLGTLNSLLRSSTIVDDEEYLKAATAAIRDKKGDQAAHHTRVVALLKLDRFEDALRALDEAGPSLSSKWALERAYALYKTGKLDEATQVLRASDTKERSLQHLAAQVAYRAERYSETAQLYRQLSNDDAADEAHDIAINASAARAQSVWQGAPLADLPASAQQYDNFELCYNAACAYLAQGSYQEAGNLLRRASMLCDSSDDLSDEEKQSEMRPILAQQAYLHLKQGRAKDALDLLQSISDAEDLDPDLRVIARNNLAITRSTSENPYVTQRQIASWGLSTKDAKLFKYQADLLAHNLNVVDLAACKTQGVQQRTQDILNNSAETTVSAAVTSVSSVNAAAEAAGLESKELTRCLTALTRKRPHDVGLALILVQLQMEQNHPGAAVATLEQLLHRLDTSGTQGVKDVRFSAGLVSLTVSLLRAQGRHSSAKHELVKAAKHWQDHPAGAPSSLLKEAGIELLRSSGANDLVLAGSAFEKLYAENPASDIAAAGLVASLAPTNPDKVEDHAQKLPDVDSLIRSVNVDRLIESGVTVAPRPHAATKRPAQDDGGQRSSKKRRKRKLPKNYVEGKTPDPERWLPLRDRSSYRPKGKKGKKKAAESTQGGVVKEEETLGLVGGGGVKVEKAAASGNSKKKKKGKK